MKYLDRRAAGTALAAALAGFDQGTAVLADGGAQPVVLGLVRGGIPVAAEVARRLGLPLDALVVRKLGVPWAPEVAFGALGPSGVQVLIDDIAARLTAEELSRVVQYEMSELGRRERLYRAGQPDLDLTGRIAIVIDDGLATGATARAAVAAVRKLGAKRVVLAVPVGAAETLQQLGTVADEVVCPVRPADFGAVSRYYEDFGQVSDAEVVSLLHA